MALNAAVTLEVRTTGVDTNGGGFKTGASGTDYSQQNTAQKSGTDLAIHASDSTKVQPIAAGVTAADIGNLIQITAGTGFTVGFYEITAQDGTYWTLDRSAGTVGSTGGTYAMGGALATIATALAVMTVAGLSCWIKASGTYSISTALSTASIGGTPYTTRTIVKGYGTTRGDGVRPVIQASAAVNGINISTNAVSFHNLDFNGNGIGLKGINVTASWATEVINCICRSWTQEGILINSSTFGFYYKNEVKLCAGTNAAFDASAGNVSCCWSHDNTVSGFNGALFPGGGVNFFRCIASKNTGASSDGFRLGYPGRAVHCIAHQNGRDGIRHLNFHIEGEIANCILTQNAAYDLNLITNSPARDNISFHHNAFYTTGTAARLNAIASEGDITLTGSPFTNAAANDYTLNNTAGAGADCRNAGFPGSLFSLTGYTDIGTYRHQDPAGGGGRPEIRGVNL